MKALKRYLTAEIGIEFKACLYFFAILFFYSVYRIANGSWQADIIVMAEIILLTYTMGYIQVYFLRNFEETEKVGVFESVASVGCALVYTIFSYILNWFDKNIAVTIGYFAYMVLCMFAMIFVYYAKRHIDTELLNEDLERFKSNK